MESNISNDGLILIPAYNEEHSIAPVVRSALAYLPVLVIDDGSSDETARLAKQAGAMVLSNHKNQGKGAALQAGIQHALDHNYDFVITLDSDGQHDPKEIPSFLKRFNAGQKELIIGQRSFTQMPSVRRFSNTLGTSIFSWAVGRYIPDNQSGFRLISRRLLEVLHESSESGFEFEVEMIVTCIQRGFSIGWVPIQTIYAGESSHIKPLKHTWKFMQIALRARRRLKGYIGLNYLFPGVNLIK